MFGGKPNHTVDHNKKTDEKIIFCHRFMIPFAAMEQVEIPSLGKQMKDVSRMNFVPCIKVNCMLWDGTHNTCGDVVKARALNRIAQSLEDEVNSVRVE